MYALILGFDASGVAPATIAWLYKVQPYDGVFVNEAIYTFDASGVALAAAA